MCCKHILSHDLTLLDFPLFVLHVKANTKRKCRMLKVLMENKFYDRKISARKLAKVAGGK
jgi:hypothetical protein